MANWTTMEFCALLTPFSSAMPLPAAILWLACLATVILLGGKIHPALAEREDK